MMIGIQSAYHLCDLFNRQHNETEQNNNDR